MLVRVVIVDDPVTMFDILMVSFFSFVLWYSERWYRLSKKSETASSEILTISKGRKFYWMCVGNGQKADLKIWTKQDST